MRHNYSTHNEHRAISVIQVIQLLLHGIQNILREEKKQTTQRGKIIKILLQK